MAAIGQLREDFEVAGSRSTNGVAADASREPNLPLIGVTMVVALVAIGGLVTLFANRPNQGFADAAAIVAVVTLGAVAIERVIEMIWSLVAQSRNAWWPLNRIYAHVTALEQNTNNALAPTFKRAEELLNEAREAADSEDRKAEVDAALEWLKSRKEQLEAQRAVLQSLAKDNQQVQLLSATAWQAVAEVDAMCTRYAPVLKETIDAANQVILGATDFIATFKDNPARRIMSLALGATLGIALAGLVGLDIFAAINETPVAAPFFGVLMTGLVMGLGSNPTHEVIRVLQEAKKSRQARNVAAPEAGGAAADPTALILSLLGGRAEQEAPLEEAGADRQIAGRVSARPRGAPDDQPPPRRPRQTATSTTAPIVMSRRPSTFSLDRRS